MVLENYDDMKRDFAMNVGNSTEVRLKRKYKIGFDKATGNPHVTEREHVDHEYKLKYDRDIYGRVTFVGTMEGRSLPAVNITLFGAVSVGSPGSCIYVPLDSIEEYHFHESRLKG